MCTAPGGSDYDMLAGARRRGRASLDRWIAATSEAMPPSPRATAAARSRLNMMLRKVGGTRTHHLLPVSPGRRESPG
jgi:hypothetical protein